MEILEYIYKSAEKFPDKKALMYKDYKLSYKQFVNEFNSIGEKIEQDISDFSYPIGIYIKNHPDFIISYYALIKAKKVAHLVDPKWRENELDNLIKHVHLGGFIVRTEEIDDFPLVEKIKHIYKYGNISLIILQQKYLSNEIATERLKNIISCRYSSGTTGIPKCMMYEERNVIAASTNWLESVNLNSNDIVYCAAYLTHGLAFNTSILAPLRVGATILLHDNITPRKVVEIILDKKPTIFVAFPVLYDLMTRIKNVKQFKNVRMCVSSGTILHESIKRKFNRLFGINISDLYGVAETGLSILNQTDDYNSVGYPLHNVKVKILGKDGEELQKGEVGEVALYTESRAKGYYNLPGELEKRLSQSYYLTGDLGEMGLDGKVYIKGRKSDVVDVAGKKVDPVEVEDVLRKHPEIYDVSVFGKKNLEKRTEILAAVVVANDYLKRETVVKFCEERLVSYKIPQIVKFVSAIPRNNNGKVLKNELQNLV
ncbi:class I adenylate-forming enzyme family protein [Bacillus toyonensis]